MKKKIVFIIIYLAVCIVPLATLGLTKADTSGAEKRELAAFPKLFKEKKLNTGFFLEFEDWFSDHMGGRTYLVEAETTVREDLFGDSVESSVIIGKNGWLFYEKTADDYCGVRTISDRNLKNIAATLKLMQDYCTEHGAHFVFTVAPNKNTLYPDNMPSRYLKGTGSNLDALTDELWHYDVRYADLREAFAADGRVLYQPRDSHWTYEGGMLAYRTILNRLGSEQDRFPEVTYSDRFDWDSDLMNMLHPMAKDNDAQVYPNIDYTFLVKNAPVIDESLIIETIGPGSGSLLMFRDSFGNTMWRYFAQGFASAQFERAVPYRLNLTERLKADTVVLEIVERNLSNLCERAPIMPAPERDISIVDAYDVSDGCGYLKTREASGFLHCYGEVSCPDDAESYRVYVVLKSGTVSRFYEACPIYEKELLGNEVCRDNGFSCYIPLSDTAGFEPAGVLCEYGGRFYYDSLR